MNELKHGFVIDRDACQGKLTCMRVCPTRAIRVRGGKAELDPELCIDCGNCLRACTTGAIKATTQTFAEIGKFKYKVAVPSPVLYSQFPVGITPAHVVEGLKEIGFDAVWDMSAEIGLVNRAIKDYLAGWKGQFPLISVSCPVTVRLIQVLYPSMIDQLIRIQPPRELAGRRLKHKYAGELGLEHDEIAAFYITPCQAKTISILQPAEEARSYLDGAIGITDVYNDILANAKAYEAAGKTVPHWRGFIRSANTLSWAIAEGQYRNLSKHRYMSVMGIANVQAVFEDIENSKLSNVDFLECYACRGGCVNGNLAVDNVYVGRSKILRLISRLPTTDPGLEEEIERRFPDEAFSLEKPVRPRRMKGVPADLRDRVKLIKLAEEIAEELPGLNCGLCGAPECRTHAEDIARGKSSKSTCILFSTKRVEELRKLYSKKREE